MISRYINKFNINYIHEQTDIKISTIKNWKYNRNIKKHIQFLKLLEFLHREMKIDLNKFVEDIVYEHEKKKD